MTQLIYGAADAPEAGGGLTGQSAVWMVSYVFGYAAIAGFSTAILVYYYVYPTYAKWRFESNPKNLSSVANMAPGLCAPAPVGQVQSLAVSAGSWTEAARELVRGLEEEGVQQGQVLCIDAHEHPLEDARLCAYFCRELLGRGPLRISYQCREGSSWEDLYAWADEVVAHGDALISVTGANDFPRTEGAKSFNSLLVFTYEGETCPSKKVEHVRSEAGTWNGAATGLLVKLQDLGVQRGQLLAIDAHNDEPYGPVAFVAFYSRGLQGCGHLALAFSCSNDEMSDWGTLERDVAGESAGRKLVAVTGSPTKGGHCAMCALFHV